jgi:Restriction alleviation protein Lar
MNKPFALKSCPFCGGRAELDGFLSGGYFVQCADEFGDCHQPVTNKFDFEEQAIRTWNLRACDGSYTRTESKD